MSPGLISCLKAFFIFGLYLSTQGRGVYNLHHCASYFIFRIFVIDICLLMFVIDLLLFLMAILDC